MSSSLPPPPRFSAGIAGNAGTTGDVRSQQQQKANGNAAASASESVGPSGPPPPLPPPPFYSPQKVRTTISPTGNTSTTIGARRSINGAHYGSSVPLQQQLSRQQMPMPLPIPSLSGTSNHRPMSLPGAPIVGAPRRRGGRGISGSGAVVEDTDQEQNNPPFEQDGNLKGHGPPPGGVPRTPPTPTFTSPSLMMKANRQMRQRQRMINDSGSGSTRRSNKSSSRVKRWLQTQQDKSKFLSFVSSVLLQSQHVSWSVPLAVFLWFGLGICSIASTKYLLSTLHVPPLILSIQQFALGGTFLHGLILLNCDGGGGKIPPFPGTQYGSTRRGGHSRQSSLFSSSNGTGVVQSISSIVSALCASLTSGYTGSRDDSNTALVEIFYTGLFFALGFVMTNYSFEASSAPLVETIKAAEPITSAFVAVSYGVDTVGAQEGLSLCGIVAGVLVSTFGSSISSTGTNINGSMLPTEEAVGASSSLWQVFHSFAIIMISNLCFSFRGLHQKLLRQTREGDKVSLNDMALQYRVQGISEFCVYICLS
jgi:hypothetical protein